MPKKKIKRWKKSIRIAGRWYTLVSLHKTKAGAKKAAARDRRLRPNYSHRVVTSSKPKLPLLQPKFYCGKCQTFHKTSSDVGRRHRLKHMSDMTSRAAVRYAVYAHMG